MIFVIKRSPRRSFHDKNHSVKKLCLFELNLRQNRPSNFDKKESKSKMQSILVVLERLNGEHLVSKRERHTPLVFELERQKCLPLKWGTRTRAEFLSSRPATVKHTAKAKAERFLTLRVE